MCKLDWERKKLLSEAMLTIGHKSIATSKEVAAAIKQIAIARWDYLAKKNLESVGFITDKDVHEALLSYYPERIVEDPDPDCVEYDNVAIID